VTTRVYECRSRGSGPLASREPDPLAQPVPRPSGFKHAALAALLLVPLAGAGERPQGWLVAALSALLILFLVPALGPRAHWGWLALLAAVAAIVTPRQQLTLIGPVLFVASGLFTVLWLVRRAADSPRDGRPRLGSPEREAQLAMGLSGELHVAQVLARELPQDYALINGLKLPRGAGDIDHVVIGPSGVFLVETKTMAGRIVCESNGTWKRTKIGRAGTQYAAYIGDPAAQVQRNIFAVRDCLRRHVPGLFGRTPLWIEGLVVFPHPRTELVAEHSRVPAMRLDQAASHICLHVPQRPLQVDEIEHVVDALLVEGNERGARPVPRAQSAQAMVEAALALPVVLALLFGTLAVSRLVQAQTGLVSVAHEAARAGSLGSSPSDAIDRIQRRVDLVAPGMGFDPHSLRLSWDVSSFAAERGYVRVTVEYRVDFGDLPLTGWIPAPVVRAEHVEWVDPFRSGVGAAEAPAR
jgi:hypothetical protein